MRLTIEQHFQAVLRHKTEAQMAIDKAMNLHKTEILRVDELYAKMDVLAFGIVGAILALNDSVNLSNPLVLIGILILISNAFWDILARLDQFEINREHAKKRMDYVHSELCKFLDVYQVLVGDQTEANEKNLDVAGMEFIGKFNEGSNSYAPRTKLTKWLGKRGYFILYVYGIIFIALGLVWC